MKLKGNVDDILAYTTNMAFFSDTCVRISNFCLYEHCIDVCSTFRFCSDAISLKKRRRLYTDRKWK